MKETQRVNSEIGAALHARFKAKCAKDRKTMTEVLEPLIRMYLKGVVKVD